MHASIKSLLKADSFHSQSGLISKPLLESIVKIDPTFKVYAKIKGVFGDRSKPSYVTAKSILDGSCLNEGEFITQVWL